MQDCVQPNKPEYSARFRHSSSLGWVCLFAARGGGGEGYVRVLKFQPLCVCIQWFRNRRRPN